MHNANRPDSADLPTSAQLLRSTAIALAAAIVILVTIVLPAEYGVDPTRIGSVIGLTEMGRIKRQLAQEARDPDGADAASESSRPVASIAATAPPPSAEPPSETAVAETPASPEWRDEATFTLTADAAAEFKLVMKEGETAEFVWFTDGARVNYDTHGDRPGVSYHGYEKGSTDRLEGSLTAAFEGSHGWFWRNRSGAPLTITLKTRGQYGELKRVL